jgi:hypothetical protein
MNDFLVFASGYAMIIAATANVGYVCFNIGVSVGTRKLLQSPPRKVLTDDDGTL